MAEIANVKAPTVKVQVFGVAEEQLTLNVSEASAHLTRDLSAHGLFDGDGHTASVVIEMEPGAWLQEVDAVLARTELGIAREKTAMTKLLDV